MEEVVEVEDEPISGSISVKGHQDSEGLPYKILSKGAWMSGCPEMGELRAFACVRCLEALTTESFRSQPGEQGILFQLYHQLSEGEMRCTKKECSGTINRDQTDLFALFVSCLDGRI